MKRDKLLNLRQEFQTMLEEYKGTEKVKLSNSILELLLFDYNLIYGKTYKRFIKYDHINKLDLQDLSFDNVDICRVDFTDLNVKINPQTVFQKNLSHIKANSVTFIGPFDGALICNADFTGSKNAIINPQTIEEKNLTFTNLKDSKLIGSLDNTFIRGTSFKGCIGNLEIDPQKINGKDLSYTNLDGVTFKGTFDDCIIEHANFENSKHAQIDPNKIKDHNLKNCNFNGVTFINPINNSTIHSSDFSKAKNAQIDLSTCIGGTSANLDNTTILKHKDEYNQKIYELKKAFKIG